MNDQAIKPCPFCGKPKEPQTCFSAGDMADAQAKAAQVEREECAIAAESEALSEPDSGNESDRAYNIAIAHAAKAIRMRGKETK